MCAWFVSFFVFFNGETCGHVPEGDEHASFTLECSAVVQYLERTATDFGGNSGWSHVVGQVFDYSSSIKGFGVIWGFVEPDLCANGQVSLFGGLFICLVELEACETPLPFRFLMCCDCEACGKFENVFLMAWVKACADVLHSIVGAPRVKLYA